MTAASSPSVPSNTVCIHHIINQFAKIYQLLCAFLITPHAVTYKTAPPCVIRPRAAELNIIAR